MKYATVSFKVSLFLVAAGLAFVPAAMAMNQHEVGNTATPGYSSIISVPAAKAAETLKRRLTKSSWPSISEADDQFEFPAVYAAIRPWLHYDGDLCKICPECCFIVPPGGDNVSATLFGSPSTDKLARRADDL